MKWERCFSVPPVRHLDNSVRWWCVFDHVIYDKLANTTCYFYIPGPYQHHTFGAPLYWPYDPGAEHPWRSILVLEQVWRSSLKRTCQWRDIASQGCVLARSPVTPRATRHKASHTCGGDSCQPWTRLHQPSPGEWRAIPGWGQLRDGFNREREKTLFKGIIIQFFTGKRLPFLRGTYHQHFFQIMTVTWLFLCCPVLIC